MIAIRGRATTRAETSDEGFILMESLVSIGLIVIILAGLTTFFIGVSSASTELRARESATVIGGNTIDLVRGMKPSDTYAGHLSSAVAAQFASAPTQLGTWLTDMYPAADDTTGVTAKLALSVPVNPVNGVNFTAQDYLGFCDLPLASSDGTKCLTHCPDAAHQTFGTCAPGYAASVPVAAFLRAIVAVTWSDPHCPNSTCAYITATLLSLDSDPNFLLNQTAPNPPAIDTSTLPDQTGTAADAIGDAVTLQPALVTNTGVNPITWTSPDLPNGLTIDVNTGLISSATTVGGSTGPGATGTMTVHVNATDAFGRTTSDTLNWQILPDLKPSDPGAQSVITTKAISTITMTATGGYGSTYTWSAPAAGQPNALPPGLSISSGGAVTGTPTTSGSYTSIVTVADSTGRTRTRSISWTVVAAPTVTGLVAKNLMPAWTSNVPLTYTCDSTNCTFTLSGAPAGTGLSLTSGGSGTASVNVTAKTGTIYLIVGAVPTGTASWSLVITPKDNTFNYTAATATATWTAGTTATTGVHSKPFTTQQINYTCPTATCTIALTIKTGSTTTTPTWLSASASLTSPTATLSVTSGTGSFYVGGTLPATTGTYTVTLTMKNASGTQLSAPVSTWTVT